MARFAVVDGNESQPARPPSDAEKHSEAPAEPMTQSNGTENQENATQPHNVGPPPDIPDSKTAVHQVPAPVTTTSPASPPSPSAAGDSTVDTSPTEAAAPFPESPSAPGNGTSTAAAPATPSPIAPPPGAPSPVPDYGAPAPPLPDYGAPAPPGPEAPRPAGDAPQPAGPLPFTPRHLRRGPSPSDTDRTPLQRFQALLTRRNALVFVPAAIVALFGLVIVTWAVDNARHSDMVHRNVTVAGHAVGGTSEETLAATVASISEELGDRPVAVVVDGAQIDSVSAADLGLVLDEQAAIDAAMDVGRGGSLLGRPFEWLGSMVNDRTVEATYTVSETQLSGALQLAYDESIQDTDTVVHANNPSVGLVEGEFMVEPGQPGTGLDLDQATGELLAAAHGTEDPFDDLELTVETTELAPDVSEEDVQALANDLNNMTASGITLNAGDAAGEETLSAEQLRGWITPLIDPEDAVGIEHVSQEEVESLEPLDWVVDYEATDAAVVEEFSELSAEPVDAEPVLSGGEIEVSESEAGVSCCGDDVGERVWEALEAGETTVEVDAEVVEPEYTTEELEGWFQGPIGGERGWRNGAEVPGPRPGYTTWDVETGVERAHNIGLMADQVNGAWIAPGETWSINDHVGARQCPPYQQAGAIVDGEHVDDDCGGGTSQFATTMLNAAYFAGLDVTGQAHSEYFDRYPAGREATMGAPGTGLNVTITNNTEYGVMIQSARQGDAVTVTLWSTPSIEVKDLGNEESERGNCRVVTNTRERTFPDGSKQTDTFTATYRPGEGEDC